VPVSAGCKPSSVPAAAGRRRRAKAICLDPPLLTGSAPRGKQPTRGHEAWTCQDRYLALHPVGFTMPATSPPPRCALTAPFHPYPRPPRLRRAVSFLWHFPCPASLKELRGTVGVTHHRGPAVLGLSSPRPPQAVPRSGLPPADIRL